MGLSLQLNIRWTLLGNVFFAACQWGSIIALARLGSPEVVGHYALGLAVATPLFMLGNLQLRTVLATDARQEYAVPDYFGVRITTSLLALIATAMIVSADVFETAGVIVVMVGIMKAIEALQDVTYGVMQHGERMDRIALSQSVRGGGGLVALVVIFHATESLAAAVAANAFVWLVVLGLVDIHSLRNHLGLAWQSLIPRLRWRAMGSLVWLSLPLGLAMLLGSLQMNFPRYVIENQMGTHALGIFSALVYFMVAGTIVISAVSQAVSPRLARYYAQGQLKAFRSLTGRLIAGAAVAGVAGCAVAVIGGGPLLRVLYGLEYEQYVAQFVWLMFAGSGFYLAAALGCAMTAMRLYRIQLPLLFAAAATTAAASILLVPEYGLSGAAGALLAGAVVQVGGSVVVVVAGTRRGATGPRHVKIGEGPSD